MRRNSMSLDLLCYSILLGQTGEWASVNVEVHPESDGYNLNDIFIIIGCAVDVTHHAWKNFKVWWFGVIKGGFYHIIEVHTF